MTYREKLIEALAKRMAFAVRERNDVSEDSTEHWAHTGDVGKAKWIKAAAAVLDLCGPEPLVWDYVSNTGTWQAQTPYGEYSVGFDDGWWSQLIGSMPWEWEPECDPRTYCGPDAAQAAAQSHATAAHWANTKIGNLSGEKT